MKDIISSIFILGETPKPSIGVSPRQEIDFMRFRGNYIQDKKVFFGSSLSRLPFGLHDYLLSGLGTDRVCYFLTRHEHNDETTTDGFEELILEAIRRCIFERVKDLCQVTLLATI